LASPCPCALLSLSEADEDEFFIGVFIIISRLPFICVISAYLHLINMIDDLISIIIIHSVLGIAVAFGCYSVAVACATIQCCICIQPPSDSCSLYIHSQTV